VTTQDEPEEYSTVIVPGEEEEKERGVFYTSMRCKDDLIGGVDQFGPTTLRNMTTGTNYRP